MRATALKDYYRILEIQPEADITQIKAAYRRMARRYHPDVSNAADAESRFKDVNQAYRTLKDPSARRTYDYLREQPAHDHVPGYENHYEPPPPPTRRERLMRGFKRFLRWTLRAVWGLVCYLIRWVLSIVWFIGGGVIAIVAYYAGWAALLCLFLSWVVGMLTWKLFLGIAAGLVVCFLVGIVWQLGFEWLNPSVNQDRLFR